MDFSLKVASIFFFKYETKWMQFDDIFGVKLKMEKRGSKDWIYAI